MGMAIDPRGLAVGCPTGVSNSGVGDKCAVHVWLLLLDQSLEFGNLANLLEGKDLILLVSVDGDTGRVVTSILEPCKTCSLASQHLDGPSRGAAIRP